MTYEVIGFDSHAKYVIFEIKGKEYKIKSNLPKSDLIAYLDIRAQDVDKDLRNDILNEARIKGRLDTCYSYDGVKWYRYEYTQYITGCIYAKYSKRVLYEEKIKLPCNMDLEEIKCYLAKNSCKK